MEVVGGRGGGGEKGAGIREAGTAGIGEGERTEQNVRSERRGDRRWWAAD